MNENTNKSGIKWILFAVGIVVGVIITFVAAVVYILNYTPKEKTYLAPPETVQNSPVYDESALEMLDEDYEAKIAELLTYIKAYGYYEDLDEKAFTDYIYKGIVAALDDPYASYYTAKEYDNFMTKSVEGAFAGIGATLQKNVETGTVTIIYVYEGSPAEAVGLQVDDLIISADGFEAVDFDLDEFVTKVRGEVGTPVELEIYRDGEFLSFSPIRDTIELPTVGAKMLDDGIAVIEIASFNDTTPGQLKKAYEDMEKLGMKAIIYDLRGNGGGVLTSVVEILDTILPEGLVCYEETLTGERNDWMSDAECMTGYPMVILTSGYTASGAELFTAALKSYDYATQVGTTTFGKGIVQSTISLGDGTALKITTKKYFGPDGICIHGEGIKPDVELEYEFLGGEEDAYDYAYDNQVQKAIEIIKEELGQ